MSEKEAKDIIYMWAMERASDGDVEACEAFDMAIKALEEIQQYRAIGTVEEVQDDKTKMVLKRHGSLSNMVDALEEYHTIGSEEQCREAVERMKPKKVKKIQIPNTSWSKACIRFECPSCNKYLNYMELSHCGLCGQALDWGEEHE